MRESMSHLTPRFSANRAVREYTEQLYLPAAAVYRLRSADNGAIGRHMVDWQRRLMQKWAGLRFVEVTVVTRDGRHEFKVQLFLNDLDPGSVRVELYADGINGNAPVRQEMNPDSSGQPTGASGCCMYGASIPAARQSSDFTARVIPYHGGVAVPLEEARILWQR
jgi:starch phosphorylase